MERKYLTELSLIQNIAVLRGDTIKMHFWNDLKIRNKILTITSAIALVLTLALIGVSIVSAKIMGDRYLQEKSAYFAVLSAETIKAAVQYSVAEDVARVLQDLVDRDSDVSVVAVVLQNPASDIEISAHKERDFSVDSLTLAVTTLANNFPEKKAPR